MLRYEIHVMNRGKTSLIIDGGRSEWEARETIRAIKDLSPRKPTLVVQVFTHTKKYVYTEKW